jgi:hypothetical protein
MTARWLIQPRDKNLGRDFDPVRSWSSLTVVERHNVTGAAAGTWQVTGRNEGLRGLFTPGNGVILFRDGIEVMSGPVTSIDRGAHESTITGISDAESTFAGRIIYPVPTQAFTNQSASAYDNRSGPAETVLLGYVDANIGPSTSTARRDPRLRLPASQGRGATQKVTGRLAALSDVVSDVAESGKLHVEVLHREDNAGPYLELTLSPVVDRSADIVFGAAGSFTGAVVGDDWRYTLARPTVTRAEVAGGGQGTSRKFIESASTDAEALWGARIESLVDQRQTTDTTELTQAGDDAISDGANPVSVAFTISDSTDVRYRRDWNIGDRVGVTIDGLNLTDVVREVTTTVTASQGSPAERVSAVVGSRDSSNWVTRDNKKVAKALRDIDRLKAI